MFRITIDAILRIMNHSHENIKRINYFDKNIAIEQLSYMKAVYKEIFDSQDLKLIIDEFDKKFGNPEMSFNKKVDFIIWSAGKILAK